MDMSKTLEALAKHFARDEDGSQVVEYGLVIALISIFVAGLLAAAFTNNNPFTTLLSRITTCMSAGGTCT
jgi:pilus assembly protein Flp/PilA